MNSRYKTYAEMMVFLHLLWFLISIVALPLALTVVSSKIFVLVFVAVTVVSIILWRGCPLRIWEKKFRNKYDPKTVYDGVFMSHYMKKFFNINMSRTAVRITISSYLILLAFVSLV
jgi:hypothetical protein